MARRPRLSTRYSTRN
uniref:Uncharacterized protein n=1 Tax=Anguilla anguilla TaxID=7936 RepID=A0A0E9T9Y9_ANGAN